jgi:hypothetical protein
MNNNPFNWQGQPSIFANDRHFDGQSDRARLLAQKNIEDGVTKQLPRLKKAEQKSVHAYSKAKFQ